MNQESHSESNDDFALDGSMYSSEDLDFVSIPFFGGALDGKAMTFGIHIVPDQFAARFRHLGSQKYETQQYALAFSECDPCFRLVSSRG